jgi:hypothetical protein
MGRGSAARRALGPEDGRGEASIPKSNRVLRQVGRDGRGIDAKASDVRVYGEVYDHHALQSPPAATTTDMGSGKPASADYQRAAYMEWVRELPYDGSDTSWTDPYLLSGDNWFFYGGGGLGQSGCR